jgi:hypothetical protein
LIVLEALAATAAAVPVVTVVEERVWVQEQAVP